MKSFKGENNPNWKGGLVIKYCSVCNKEIRIKPSRVKNGGGKYCSIGCMAKGYSILETGSGNPRWLNIPRKKCNICGKKYKVGSVRDLSIRKCCSRKCMGKWRTKYLSGNKSFMWQGGITANHLIIRGSEKYNTWRLNIFTRDNFTCTKCGQIRGDIQVHHIKRFSIILNDIKQKFPLLSISDVAVNHPDLWDIKNGVTLCKKCHKKEHAKRK